MSFSGQTVAITGAGSGIGRALALDFAGRGANLALSDWNQEGLDETISLVGGRVRCEGTRLDVANREAVEAWAKGTIDTFGRADMIINNAGVSVSDTIANLSYDDFEWIVGINFWGAVYGTKAFLPHMLERNTGWVVNISSIFGIISMPTQGAYNATKFALRGFTEALHQELLETGVNSLSVHPGGVDTNIVKSARLRVDFVGNSDQDLAATEFKKVARTTPTKAAATIIRHIERGKNRCLIGKDAKALDRVQRFFPQTYWKVMRKFINQQAAQHGK